MAAKTGAEIIKSLFGDKETMTSAELIEAYDKSGIKMVDLEDGQFVNVAKYNDRIAKIEKERDVQAAKVKEYEEQKTIADRTKVLADLGVSEDFREFVLSKVESGLQGENPDFDAEAKKFVESHKQYVNAQSQPEPENPSPEKYPSSFPLGKSGNVGDGEDGDFAGLTKFLKTGEF